MKLEKFSTTQSITLTVSVEFLQIEKDLYAYRFTRKSQEDEPSVGNAEMKAAPPLPPSFTETGLVSEEGKLAILSGAPREKLSLSVINPLLREKIRTDGWQGSEKEIYEAFFLCPWEYFTKTSSASPDDLVKIDNASHMVFERSGKPLPMGIMFDYIRSHISESTHDLVALATHLLGRPDVVVYDGRKKKMEPAKSPKEAIFQIPSYNADDGRSESVQFLWKPFPEDYQRVWDLCMTQPFPSTHRHEAVLNMDILEIEAFRLRASHRLRP